MNLNYSQFKCELFTFTLINEKYDKKSLKILIIAIENKLIIPH